MTRKNNCLAHPRSSQGNPGTLIRLSLCLFAISSGLMFAWTLSTISQAHASGVTETATQTNPWAIALDNASHVWVAEPGCDAEPTCTNAFSSYIGEYSSSDTLLHNYLEPQGYSSPVFLSVTGKGIVWFTEPKTNAIGSLTPSNIPVWHQWKVPTPNANPYDLVPDTHGNIWFTEYSANKIGFFNTTKHSFVETAIHTPASQPYGITRDPSGNIWFVENLQQKIASFTPTTSGKVSITEHVTNSPAGPVPHLIVADGAGNIWYSEAFSGDIGEFNPKTHTARNINVSQGAGNTHISGIAVDKTGRIWFDDSLSARVGVYTPSSGTLKTLTLSNRTAHPHNGLAVDGGGNIWVAEVYGGPTGSLAKIAAGTL